MAFVFLNRYLDLTEAMDDADAGPLENADFVDTDIPCDFHIPSKHYIPEAMQQQVLTPPAGSAFSLQVHMPAQSNSVRHVYNTLCC